MKNLSAALFILLFFQLTNCFGQFTYAGAKLSYHNVRFDKSSGIDEQSTRINDFVLNLDLIHRPVKYLGVGFSYRIPIIRGFKYNFSDDRTGNEVSGNGTTESDAVDFLGGQLYYNIKNTSTLSLIGRVYFDTEMNYYLDIRYSFENYEENFSFKRANDFTYSDRNFNYTENVTVRGIGFAFGVTTHVSDHLYLNYAFTVDFLGTSDRRWSYSIDQGSLNDFIINSKIDDTQTAYEFSYGIGYVF